MHVAASMAAGEEFPFRIQAKQPYRKHLRIVRNPEELCIDDEVDLPNVDDLEVAAAAAEAALAAMREYKLPEYIQPAQLATPDHSPNEQVIVKIDISENETVTVSIVAQPASAAPGAEYEFDSSSEDLSSDSDQEEDTKSSLSSMDEEITDYEQIKKLVDAMEDGQPEDVGGHASLHAADHELFGDFPLPDVSQILISEEETLCYAGEVQAHLEGMVVVKAPKNQKVPLNEGCVLILESARQPIGIIEDIFGPITDPLYALRFCGAQEVYDSVIQGARIAFVERLANYIPNYEELKEKGYDANDVAAQGEDNDNVEFSDDEAEAQFKRQLKAAKRKTSDGPRVFGGLGSKGATKATAGQLSGMSLQQQGARKGMRPSYAPTKEHNPIKYSPWPPQKIEGD